MSTQIPQLNLNELVQSVGEQLSVDTQTGAVQFSYPIPLPESRTKEATPSLELTYAPSAANSSLGRGWTLSQASIRRKTYQNFPTYLDDTEQDQFLLSGFGALLPMLNEQGERIIEEIEGYKIFPYRTLQEGNFARIERRKQLDTGATHWLLIQPNNTKTWFGLEDAEQIKHPTNEQQIAEWLVSRMVDDKGNAMVFEYKPEDLAQVDQQSTYEYQRSNAPTQKYLKRIFYGNTLPFSFTATWSANNTWLFEVVLDYGEHLTAAIEAYAATLPWKARVDAFSSYRTGFEIRNYRLCERILVFSHFSQIQATPTLTSAVQLQYELINGQQNLMQIQYIGYQYWPQGYQQQSLPPIELDYSGLHQASDLQTLAVQTLDLEHVPAGVDGIHYKWMDLYQEGLAGILVEYPDAWYFKRNKGNGEFDALEQVALKPSLTQQGSFELVDWDGNGQLNCLVTINGQMGYYELDAALQNWSNYHSIGQVPQGGNGYSINMDVDGEGLADLVQFDAVGSAIWYNSKGKIGYDNPQLLQLPETLPLQFINYQNERFTSADMTGDGLQDLVHIHNGGITYWPHLGYGKFGTACEMECPSLLDEVYRFDVNRCVLLDIDGTGSTDLIYIDKDQLHLYLNHHGNQLQHYVSIEHLGGSYTPQDTITVLDLLGTGVRYLVWSTVLPGQTQTSLQYLPLSDQPVHLLTSVNNNMGRVSTLTYTNVAQQAIEDEAKGQAWFNRSNSAATVLTELKEEDKISGTQTISTFRYRDGFYDTDKRQFRGFAYAEQLDTTYTVDDADSAEDYVSPRLIKQWFFNGLLGQNETYTQQFYTLDGAKDIPLPHFKDAQGQSLIPSIQEQQEAFLRLNGQLRRQEVHQLDPIQSSCLTIDSYAFELRRYQIAYQDFEPSFAVLPVQQIRYNCEGVGFQDAAIQQSFQFDFNAYGKARGSCQISYGRQGNNIDVAQQQSHFTYQKQVFSHLETASDYYLNIPIEQKEYAISGIDNLYQGTPLSESVIQQHLQQALQTVISSHANSNPLLTQAQLLKWVKQYYGVPNNQITKLPHGQLQAPILPHHNEQVAFEASWANQYWVNKLAANDFTTANYHLADNYYWSKSDAQHYHGATAFYQLHRKQHVQGGFTTYTYDAPLWLLLETVENPLQQTQQFSYDYQQLAPRKIIDLNGNIEAIHYDPLGFPMLKSHYGNILDEQAQLQPQGNGTLELVTPLQPNSIQDLLNDPLNYLQGASTYTYYDLYAWKNQQQPIPIVTIQREEYLSKLPPDTTFQQSIHYLDGFKRILQAKLLVEAGTALAWDNNQVVEVQVPERWLVSGHTMYNVKSLPLKQYEPYFSNHWAYNSNEQLQQQGEYQQFLYDAQGRVITNIKPNGTFSKTIYEAWKTAEYDAIDTLQDSFYFNLAAALPDDQIEKQILNQTLDFYNTPTIHHLTAQQLVYQTEQLDEQQQALTVYYHYDVLGQLVEQVDARGLSVLAQQYDLLGNVIQHESVDTGQQYFFYDAQSNLQDSWTAKGEHVHQDYDLLNRPTDTWVQDQQQLYLAKRLSYGNSLPVQEAQNRNALGQLVKQQDGSGERRFKRYDILNNLLEQQQAFTQAYKGIINWDQVVPLDSTWYISEMHYDALGRLIYHKKPDDTIHLPEYHQSGRLKKLQVYGLGGDAQTSHTFLENSQFNARGQVELLQYGNQVTARYAYDNKTFELSQFKAIHHLQDNTHRHLQWNDYYYDAVGNVRQINDFALPKLLGQVDPSPWVNSYQYDAYYRLKKATGTIHQAFNQWDGTRNSHSQPPSFKGTQYAHLNNLQALEQYERRYQYDASGNMLQMKHLGQSKTWTRNYWVDPNSNKSLSATDTDNQALAQFEQHFDAAGNLIRFSHLRQVHWDVFNQLSQVVLIERENDLDDAEYYCYDASGMRQRKVTERLVNGQLRIEEVLYLDGCHIARQLKPNLQVAQQTQVTYVEGEQGSKLALIDYIAIGAIDNEPSLSIRYQLGNHLGSVAMEVDEQGQIISYEAYFPFGGTAFMLGNNQKEVSKKRFRFSGKERDDATGLYYYGFRYYAPWLCRWVSADPSGVSDGPNVYQFVYNNPITFVDVWGLEGGKLIPVPPGTSKEDMKKLWEQNYGKIPNGAYLAPLRTTKINGKKYRVWGLRYKNKVMDEGLPGQLLRMGFGTTSPESDPSTNNESKKKEKDANSNTSGTGDPANANNAPQPPNKAKKDEATGNGGNAATDVDPNAKEGSEEGSENAKGEHKSDQEAPPSSDQSKGKNPKQKPSSTTGEQDPTQKPKKRQNPGNKSDKQGQNNPPVQKPKKKGVNPDSDRPPIQHPKKKSSPGKPKNPAIPKDYESDTGNEKGSIHGHENGTVETDNPLEKDPNASSTTSNGNSNGQPGQGNPNGSLTGNPNGSPAGDPNGTAVNGSPNGVANGSPTGSPNGRGNGGGSGGLGGGGDSDGRSFMSRGGTTLLLGALVLGLGIFTVMTGGGALIMFSAGMAIGAGGSTVLLSTAQLTASYTGYTTIEQDHNIMMALTDALSVASSPGSAIGGGIGMAVDGQEGMRKGAFWGGVTEGVAMIGVMAYRGFTLRPPKNQIIPDKQVLEPTSKKMGLEQWSQLTKRQRKLYEKGQRTVTDDAFEVMELKGIDKLPVEKGKYLSNMSKAERDAVLTPWNYGKTWGTGLTPPAQYITPMLTRTLGVTFKSMIINSEGRNKLK